MTNVVCLKWGTKYSSDYVNRLHSMVKRNLTIKHRFICLTDDPTGINPDIECLPIPDEDGLTGWWFKLMLFKKRLHNIGGPTLFLDLDVVITGNIDGLFTHRPGEFAIIRDWSYAHRVWNSSVFRLDIGSHPDIWNDFQTDKKAIMKRLHGDQDWITERIPECTTWPTDWVISYKVSCNAKGSLDQPAILPEGAKIVVFHGLPNPGDVMNAPSGRWRHAPWIKDHWR